MKLDVLMSCMHQADTSLISKTGINGNAVVINQCDVEDYIKVDTERGIAEMYSVTSRGLTKSRNLAISRSNGDICLLCDDDEVLVDDYEFIIINAYKNLVDADIIAFDLENHPCSLKKRIQRLKFPKTMKICSCQITFRRESILKKGVKFDELLGAGTGNGAEEELKFLRDCQNANLKIYFVPQIIAKICEDESTWFSGFDEKFFENRGATTRYILGWFLSSLYAIYYVLRKRNMYKNQISVSRALRAIFKGIHNNKISKQSKQI